MANFLALYPIKECVSILDGYSSYNLGFGTLLTLWVHPDGEQKRIGQSESQTYLPNSPCDSFHRFAYKDHLSIRAITLKNSA